MESKAILGMFCIVSAIVMISCGSVLYFSGIFYTSDRQYPQHPTQLTDVHDEICEPSSYANNLNVMPHYTRPITANSEWVCNLYREVK